MPKGSTTMSITPRHTSAAASVCRPPIILMTRRCNGKREIESTVAQTIAVTNGQSTKRQPTSSSRRIPLAILFSIVEPDWFIEYRQFVSRTYYSEHSFVGSKRRLSILNL